MLFLSCVCYSFVRFCLLMPYGHLLGIVIAKEHGQKQVFRELLEQKNISSKNIAGRIQKVWRMPTSSCLFCQLLFVNVLVSVLVWHP